MFEERRHGTAPVVSINGTELRGDADSLVTRVEVDQDLTMPTSCEIEIADHNRDLLSEGGFELGQEITIEASPVETADDVEIFKGIIHSIELSVNERGRFLIITAYDELFKLVQQRITKTFNSATVGDVVSGLCDEVDIRAGSMDLDGTVIEKISVFDETPWEFITRHAAASSCIVRLEDGKLNIVKPEGPGGGGGLGGAAGGMAGDLLGESGKLSAIDQIQELQVRWTSATQVGEVVVQGWDPAKKEMVSGSANAEATSHSVDVADPAGTGEDLGAAAITYPRPSEWQQSLVDLQATALAETHASRHVFAEGVTVGDPTLSPGGTVTIEDLDNLSGAHLLTKCHHLFDQHGYFTRFSCCGLEDRSVMAMLQSHSERPRRSGVFPGTVVSVDDPDQLGRVCVTFPWLSDDYESSWARVCQIGAGPERGIHWFPEVDDEVMVTFIDGDPAAPVVIAGVYNGVDKPPFESFVDAQAGEVVRRGFKTRAGHLIELIDSPGEEAIKLLTADEQLQVHLDQANQKITIESSGELELTASTSLTISTSGTGKIEASGGLELTSDGSVTISGTTVDVSGQPINLN